MKGLVCCLVFASFGVQASGPVCTKGQLVSVVANAFSYSQGGNVAEDKKFDVTLISAVDGKETFHVATYAYVGTDEDVIDRSYYPELGLTLDAKAGCKFVAGVNITTGKRLYTYEGTGH